MSVEKKWTFVSIVSIGIGIGTVFIAGRSLTRAVVRWKASKSLHDRLKKALNDPIPTTRVISRTSEWDDLYPLLTRDCVDIPILGFDCEWVSLNRAVQPVALIQLASHTGVCALVRICCLPSIPETLKSILSDPRILKVGVATWEDSLKLKKDFGLHLSGVYDVRHSISRHPNKSSLLAKSGLSGLSEQLLGATLNKKFSIRCSDWEADDLHDTQIKYAAQDAIASIAVCLKLVEDTNGSVFSKATDLHTFYQSWSATCKSKDTKFRLKSNASWTTYTNNSKSKSFTPTKPNNTRAYAARKSALYDNCVLQAPDGQQLCTCDYKKAMWYVSKGRGEVVAESPVTVRLNFEPAGRPSSEYDQYYLMDKANKCVVCGQTESFLRKNVVPHEYRKHFPDDLKDHKSHDILLLCLDCHTTCNFHENSVKNELSLLCSAPIGTEKDVKMKLDKRLSGVQKAANALSLKSNSIPEDRVKELEDIIKTYYEVDSVTPDILEMARNLEIHVANVDYSPHGLKVVRHFEKEEGGLLALERLWREHFLRTMKPRHLPELWSVEHHRKPEEKWGSDMRRNSLLN